MNTIEQVYTFQIEEKATYIQTGTVSVSASSLKEAKQKVKSRDYDHHGDNGIDCNTESNVKVLSVTKIN
jgi:hypothetical protein